MEGGRVEKIENGRAGGWKRKRKKRKRQANDRKEEVRGDDRGIERRDAKGKEKKITKVTPAQQSSICTAGIHTSILSSTDPEKSWLTD